MPEKMRDVVRDGYEKGHYDITYARDGKTPENLEKALCDELISRLNPGSKILDLGCGVGLPYDRYFADNGFSVTGVDISEKHIEKARKNVKGARYIVGDFFSEATKCRYDAIVSFYAIFHIPRTEHRRLLEHMHSLLKKQGLILITLGTDPMKCDYEEDFAGAKMAWSSYGVSKNKKIVQDSGFEMLLAAEDNRKERHLWILAKKK